MSCSILIAGIGNMFFGDDAFGCEVTRRLGVSLGPPPDDVEVRDFGVSVRALGYSLAARSSGSAPQAGTTVIIDAVATGAAPGTLQLFDLASAELRAQPHIAQHAHGLQDALDTTLALGGRLERTWLLGCEPASLEPAFSDVAASATLLTPAVEAAACRCVVLLMRLIDTRDRDLLRVCASALTTPSEA